MVSEWLLCIWNEKFDDDQVQHASSSSIALLSGQSENRRFVLQAFCKAKKKRTEKSMSVRYSTQMGSEADKIFRLFEFTEEVEPQLLAALKSTV